MINFNKTKFIKSAPSVDYAPEVKMAEILFVGRSNVGKSSLINALCSQKNLAKTSGKPGHTKLLNYFSVDNKFYLVDAPGYGYHLGGGKHTTNFGEMMEDYFQNKLLKAVVFIVDSRHELSRDDKEFYAYIKELQIPFVLVMSKSDKLNQSERYKANKQMKDYFEDNQFIMFTSITNNKSISDLRAVISKFVD